MDSKPRRRLQYKIETPNTTPSPTGYGYLKLTSGATVPADRNGVRTSGASERFSGSTQERVQTPDRIISRPKTARARPTPPEPSSTELLDVESREKRTTLHVPRDVIEDACCSKGDDETNGGLRHPTSPCLPHRRTRSMVGLVSPLSVVPATTPVNVSLCTLGTSARRGLTMHCTSFLPNFEV